MTEAPAETYTAFSSKDPFVKMWRFKIFEAYKGTGETKLTEPEVRAFLKGAGVPSVEDTQVLAILTDVNTWLQDPEAHPES